MYMLGTKKEWRFVDSIGFCDIEKCQEKAILFERLSGKRLCEKHGKENGDAWSNAIKNHHFDNRQERKRIYKVE